MSRWFLKLAKQFGIMVLEEYSPHILKGLLDDFIKGNNNAQI